MYSQKKNLFFCIFLIFLVKASLSITCYRGLELNGNGRPQKSEECSDDYCYKIVGHVGEIVSGDLYGCSTFRCSIIGNDKCSSAELFGFSATVCCCDQDNCNY